MDYQIANVSAARAVRSAYGIPDKTRGMASPAEKEEKVSFEDLLGEGLKSVNRLQLEAGESMKALATGDVDDISEVAAVVSEADLSLRMAVQIRDKLVDAYNQLARISV